MAFDTGATFTAALTAICGGRVRVVIGGQARTDGNTIYLPLGRDVLTPAERAAIFGIGCHEAAHVYYSTPAHQGEFVEGFSPDMQPLAALCFNGVVDVADESRFESIFPGAIELLSALYTSVAANIVGHQRALAHGDDSAAPRFNTAEEIVAFAIVGARHRRILDPGTRQRVRDLARCDAVAGDCVAVLQRATYRGRIGSSRRLPRSWKRLGSLARCLMDILQCNGKTVTSDCAAPCTLEAGGGGGALGHYFHAVIEDAIGVPSPRSDPDEPDRVDGILDPRLHAIFRRHIRALTDTPLLLPAAPSHRGRRLGDVTRYPIDRKVLLSPREQRGSDAAIAFGLDCSDSMARVLARFAGALHELVQASMAVGCVVATFHFGSEVRRVAPRRVSRAPLLNQTRTDLFLRQADEWLKRQRQRRRNVILFTDGEPQYPVECAEAVRRLQQQGIQILVGTVTGLDPSRLDLSMPSVSCFEIGETDLEAGLLRAVRRLAWR